MENKQSISAGVGLVDLLLITFIVLKLVGVIDWPWLWILSPCWLPILIIFGFGILLWFIDNHERMRL